MTEPKILRKKTGQFLEDFVPYTRVEDAEG